MDRVEEEEIDSLVFGEEFEFEDIVLKVLPLEQVERLVFEVFVFEVNENQFGKYLQ